MKKITKVCLTGGPCAGKTTALVRILEHFTSLGYKVFTLPEIPTMMSTAGMNYLTKNPNLFYEGEKATLKLQLEIEDHFTRMAETCEKPVIIVCDRGTMDISAYMSPVMWQALMDETATNTVKLRDARYDAVLHLVSAANGAEQFYTTSNNQQRTEGIELARELDNKVIAAWTGHPHLRVIGNTEKFDTKLHHVLTEISKVLGAPAPIESERKYIVEVTGEIPGYIESEITQTYLLADPGSEVRLRKRGWQGSYEYFQTAKKQVSETEMIETERHITPHQYYMLMQQVDPERRPIKKIRKNFVWEGQYFELDTYIEPAIGLNILEIEGVTDHASIHFPPFLKILEDITGNTDYYNYTLAKK